MSTKVRRNQSHKPVHSSPPFNELWESFHSLLEPIFQERLPEGKRSELYIPVPTAERDLEKYINTDAQQVAILHGLMGAGKSTILEHFSENHLAAQKPNRKTLYLNFQGRRYHLMPDLDFFKLSREERRLAARTIVTKRLNELLSDFMDEYIDYVNVNFFDFLRKYFHGEIGRRAFFARDDATKLKLLETFMCEADQTASIQCFILFVAKTMRYDEFIIVVDNVDEQAYEIVEGLFFALSDFVDCLMRPRRRQNVGDAINADAAAPPGATKEYVHQTRFKAILACRSHTFVSLRDDHEGILNTRGYHEIELKSGSLLTQIIKKRIDAARDAASGKRPTAPARARQDAPYTLRKSGITVKVDDALRFIETFVGNLTQASIESRLFELFNQNHARAIQNLKYVIQNRYFVSYDTEVLSRGEIVTDFQYARVLKALAYGNPEREDSLYYPAQSTIIPNLLTWERAEPDSFFSVIRFLQWMQLNCGHTGITSLATEGRRADEIVSIFEADYGITTGVTR